MRFAFIQTEKANYSIRLMCRVLKVSTSGYYAYIDREPSERQKQDATLKLRIRAVHSATMCQVSRGLRFPSGCPDTWPSLPGADAGHQ